MKNRVAQLDWARVFLTLSIIALHTTSTFIFSESGFRIFGVNLSFFINQAVRFGVPGFFILSGAALNLSKAHESMSKFYINRIKKIVLPYLFWYTIYFVVGLRLSGRAIELVPFLKGLLRGSSAPHLYFIVVIIQLYLLYPLLRRLMDRYRRQTAAAAFVIGLFFQTLAYLAGLGKFGLPRDNNLYLMFFTWIHFFVLGMCITPESLEKLCRRAGKLLPLTAVLFALSAVLVTLEGRAMGSYESGMRPWFFVYAPLALLLFLGLGTYLMRLTPLNTCVMHMSAISMDVYFIHVLVLMYLRRFPVFLAGTRGMLLLFMAVSVISFLAAAMISAAKKLCLRLLRPGHIKG